MAISYVGAVATVNAATGVTSSGAVTLPTVVAADLLILAVHRTHDYALTSGTPTGYTFLRNMVDVAASPNAAHTDIYYRTCDGTETTTGPTFTTGSTTRWVVHAAAYRGVDAASPFIVENGQQETAGSATASHSAPAITNTDAAAWAVFAALVRGVITPSTWTPPTGLTERLDTDTALATAPNLTAEWADSNGAVATGAATYTATSSGTTLNATMWAAFLKPSSAPAAPTGLSATAISSTAIDVGYTRASGSIGEDIERDGVVIASAYSGSLPFHDTGLTPSTLYSYRVRSTA